MNHGTRKRGTGHRIGALLAAFAAAIGMSAGFAPQANAAPGDCAQPTKRDYIIESKNDLTTVRIGTVSANITACPDQNPSGWQVTPTQQDTSFLGGTAFLKLSAQPDNEAIGPNDRTISLRIKLERCAIPVEEISTGCYTEDEFLAKYHLVRANGEVTTQSHEVIDPTPGPFSYTIRST